MNKQKKISLLFFFNEVIATKGEKNKRKINNKKKNENRK